MKYLLIFAAVFVGLILFYALKGRSWLKAKTWPWSIRFFQLIEPYEIVLWKKSETILLARSKMVVGLLLTALTQAGAIDITPLMPLVPDQYEGVLTAVWNLIPMIVFALGVIDEKMRNDTTKPLELVALPDAVAATMPEVVIAEAAKTEAVAAVVEAKVDIRKEAVIKADAAAVDAPPPDATKKE